MLRYEDDFCAWIDHAVGLLRAGQWEEVDTEHVRLLPENCPSPGMEWLA